MRSCLSAWAPLSEGCRIFKNDQLVGFNGRLYGRRQDDTLESIDWWIEEGRGLLHMLSLLASYRLDAAIEAKHLTEHKILCRNS